MKKISFVIPVYNIKKYIEKCINSILEQNNNCIEIIIVNDGSTDGVENILLDYETKYNFIKIIKKMNGGLSSARNRGLASVSGDYVWFVDGDDTIEKNSISIIYDTLKKDDYDIIFFNYYKDYGSYKKEISEPSHYMEEKSKILVNTSPCTKIFRKQFLSENNFKFDEGIIYEDLASIPYLISKAKKSKFIDEYLYNYVYRENSIMNSKSSFKKNRDDKFLAITYLIQKFKNDKSYESYFEEIEYLAIKHLLITYSTEIIIYEKNIYVERFNNVINVLNKINCKWYKNKYFQSQSIFKKIYVWFFRKKMFSVCKFIVFILRKVGKI